MRRCLLLLACTAALAAAETVVVHHDRAASRLDRAALEAIFTGRRTTWPDGRRIVVVALEEGPSAERFLTAVAGKSPAQFRMSWRRLVFTGQGRAPVMCRDDAAVVAVVAADRDAIGFIDAASPHDPVAVLSPLQ